MDTYCNYISYTKTFHLMTKQLDKQPISQKVELVEQVETPNVWMMNALTFGSKKIVFY
jgi:hypothetical protein